MNLPLDDQQLMRHNASQMADGAYIIYQELGRVFGYQSPLVHQLLLEWWKISLASSLQPDFGAMLRAIVEDQE